MKLIIAGSRTINISLSELEDLAHLVMNRSLSCIDQLVSGECEIGPDSTCTKLAKDWTWTESNGKYKGFPAKWKEFGRKAGHIRNAEMADYADALLLIWDGKSPGSKNMLAEMKKRKKPIYEVIIRKHNVKY